jgi:hypothetical protein
MLGVLKFLIGLVLVALATGFFRTWQIENSDNQKLFASSSAPKEKLNGLYKGSVNLPVKVTWLGKKFDSKTSTGINVFDDGGGTTHDSFPFNTYAGSSSSSTALYIDYDKPENPFWIRPIVDQLVEVNPGDYLGKLSYRLIPGYNFELEFFRLKK